MLPRVCTVNPSDGIPTVLHRHIALPKSAYELWLDDSLFGELRIPIDKRTRLEVIDGEIVASTPLHVLRQARVAAELHRAFLVTDVGDRSRWRTLQGMYVNLPHIREGYAPDMTIMRDRLNDVIPSNACNVPIEHVDMVIEMPRSSTAALCREPTGTGERLTKWHGYARECLRFYLFIDGSGAEPCVTLFSDPDPARGTFRSAERWPFGETIVLPEPFNVEIVTDKWLPWGD